MTATTEITTPKPNGAHRSNGSTAPPPTTSPTKDKAAQAKPGRRPPTTDATAAKIIKQLAAGVKPSVVSEQLGVHPSTVYYHRSAAIERGELKGTKGKRKEAPPPKAAAKRKAARGAATMDAIVWLEHALDTSAPELRRVSNEALLTELALRRLDGRMQ